MAEVELHADVVASLARVLGVRRRRPVIGGEEPGQDQRLGDFADLATNLVAEGASDLGGIDDLGHGGA